MRSELKWLVAGVLLSAALTGRAQAQLLRPIDPRQQAEVNGKTIDLSTLNLNAVSEPMLRPGVSELTGKRASPGRQVEMPVVETELRQYSVIPGKIIPRANFAPKRAVVPDRVPAMPPVPTEKAPVSKRTIRPLTPAGAEELKQQLNTPH